MELTENKIFIGFGILVIVVAFAVYMSESSKEKSAAKPVLSTVQIPKTTSTLITTTIPVTSTVAEVPKTEEAPETTTTLVTTSIPTTTTVSKADAYFSKYSGKGLRLAYVNMTYYCPSCVPIIAHNLANTAGIIAKSMSYRQKVSWFVYDPTKVSLETVRVTAEGSGEAIVLNDTEL